MSLSFPSCLKGKLLMQLLRLHDKSLKYMNKCCVKMLLFDAESCFMTAVLNGSSFLGILSCLKPDGCQKFDLGNATFLSLRPQSPTSLHHLQDEELTLRAASLPSVVKELYSNLFAGIAARCFCQTLTELPRELWSSLVVLQRLPKIRLPLFSPQLYRNLLYFPDE